MEGMGALDSPVVKVNMVTRAPRDQLDHQGNQLLLNL